MTDNVNLKAVGWDVLELLAQPFLICIDTVTFRFLWGNGSILNYGCKIVSLLPGYTHVDMAIGKEFGFEWDKEVLFSLAAPPLVKKADELALAGEFEKALDIYKAVLDMNTKQKIEGISVSSILQKSGCLLIALGQIEKAKKAFQDSLKLEPEHKLALRGLDYIKRILEK